MFVSKIRTVEIKTKINTYFFDKIVDDDKKPIEKLKETILKDLYNNFYSNKNAVKNKTKCYI